MKAIKDGDVRKIQYELVDSIFFFEGNKQDIEEAIEFAKANSSFEFEEYIDLPTVEPKDDKDLYSIEKLNLKTNFSKERFDRLVNLYDKVYAWHTRTKKTNQQNTDNSTTKIVVTVVIAVGLLVGAVAIIKSCN